MQLTTSPRLAKGGRCRLSGPQGLIEVCWTPLGLSAVKLLHPRDVDASGDDALPLEFAGLRAYLRGERVDFDDVPVDLTSRTPFHRRVLGACREVKYGETTTYGELARRIGQPGAARAVGGAMRRNPVPIVIPCHRVLSSGGGIGGFSAPEGVTLKERLLAMERRWSVKFQPDVVASVLPAPSISNKLWVHC